MTTLLENPFINNKIIVNYHDDNSGEIIELTQENISKYFSHVYILVKKNSDSIPVEFYSQTINQEIFNKVASNLLIHKTTIKLLKNRKHFDSIIMMSNDQLKQFNIFNYDLANKNIVIPIFNIAYQNIIIYLEQYESLNTLTNIYNMKVLNSYFKVNIKNYKINESLCKMISNLEDSEYWTQYYNCQINLTKKFTNRNFLFQINRLENKEVVSIIKTITNDECIKNDENDENDKNYIGELEKTKQKEKYIDISSVINSNGYKLYRIGPKSEFTHDNINQLFDTLNDKQKFLLFSELIVSKKHCHLVLNNEKILTMMESTINIHKSLFKYLISYAWIQFYFEECIKKSHVKTDDNFIFDINTASKLPLFPFNHLTPKANPYMPLLVADSELKPLANVCGIADYATNIKKFINAGICNFDKFKTNMNIFCTGNSNLDIFEGVNFEKYKIGITGSIITACIQKAHPLMSQFINCDTEIELLNNYFNEYYAKSDIDVMIYATDNFTFIDSVREFYNQIIINICKFNSPYAEPSNVKLKCNKIGYLFVSEEFIINNIHLDIVIDDKIKYIIDNINDESIKNHFKPYYEQLKKNKINEICKDFTLDGVKILQNIYPEIFDDCDFKIFIDNKKSTKTTENNNLNNELNNDSEYNSDDLFQPHNNKNDHIDLVYTYKFLIESPYLNHCFELFPVRNNDFMSLVTRFHLPCVRGYYNGSNVYLTPSCISAHMTYMNIDYKYISGSKDPIEIINKNRIRGFGTWLNSQECTTYIKYSRKIPVWNNLYNISSSISDNDASKQILGPLSLKHKLFRPRLYNMDEYLESNYVDTTNRYNNLELPNTLIEDKISKINVKNTCNQIQSTHQIIDDLQAINQDGYIIPLKKWVINMSWELVNSNNSNETKNNPSESKNESKIKTILSK